MKIKVIVTAIREMDIEEDWYPQGVRTTEEISKFEEESISQDPFAFLDNEDVELTVKCEVIDK